MSRSSHVHEELFESGSRTYFNSSRFFPSAVRDDVYLLYGFVRTADNFVDTIPQDGAGFYRFVEQYQNAVSGVPANDPVIDGFVELARRLAFAPEWTEAFLHSMEMDLVKSVHSTLPETLEYVYGSAEVIGLYMVRILGLEKEAEYSAQRLGRAMQFINFIRDIGEDVTLGRTYLPISESSFGSLKEEETRQRPEEFRNFIGKQLVRYDNWQKEAESGYSRIPYRYRTAIRTAGDMYNWTGRQIRRDPFGVYRRKIKPSRPRIVFRGVINTVRFWK